jgi:Fe-S-cluster-containing dehydrogenase component
MPGVRMFGDLDDPDSEVFQYISKNKLKQFKGELNTNPRIHYKKA